jgi:hypothetical protein
MKKKRGTAEKNQFRTSSVIFTFAPESDNLIPTQNCVIKCYGFSSGINNNNHQWRWNFRGLQMKYDARLFLKSRSTFNHTALEIQDRLYSLSLVSVFIPIKHRRSVGCKWDTCFSFHKTFKCLKTLSTIFHNVSYLTHKTFHIIRVGSWESNKLFHPNDAFLRLPFFISPSHKNDEKF